ncbi:unnamed protein product [Kuraishia capsulata CBS 1993]|uniref:Glutaredoxin domain-containing protein n=1 Tax=Kuraishia capsulata CBS 1993 TaxID=1382522 RepID=W6MTT0_9ASCO|nr:uncharacterized protein KUCA_T00005892001 [Kuraishia capsulata CBS 1993]CDK29898.1 unnamed protein product [Kuraishia capsulata CBS 1993]
MNTIALCAALFILYKLYRKFFSTSTSRMVSSAVKTKVEGLIKSKPIFVASKTYCPYCSASKKTLDSLDADAYILELDTLSDGDEIQAALAEISGQRTVPNIYIGGEHIGGNSDLQALKSNGKLVSKIKASKL